MVILMVKKNNPSLSQFDQIVIGRIFSEDFAQPAVNDHWFYKNKAVAQISSAVKAIRNATNQHDFSTAIAQANAFLDAAYDYEFIDLTDKSKWLYEIAQATRVQTIGEHQ